jgi:outer membrane lipoprotein-sorting protein
MKLARVALLAFLFASSARAEEPVTRYDPVALAAIEAMTKASRDLRDYTMTLVKRELRGKELSDPEMIVIKWQPPQRIYLHEIAGEWKGQEVLYALGWNKNRIKVHPGTFPYFTVNLDPYGNLAMAHSHHPVPDVSLVRFVDLVTANVQKARAKNVGTIRAVGREDLWGRSTMKLEMTTPPTGTTPTIGKGETIWDVAKATGQDMYVILHANRARGWWRADHPERGDAVIVPDFYAGRMVLWIDDDLHLPIQADLYDHDGNLYEHYEHRELKVNVGLGDADFDPKHPGYHF